MDDIQTNRAITRQQTILMSALVQNHQLIVEDVARMIAKCQTDEELRDLSVQIRKLMFEFDPDASRVALTMDEAMVLHAMGE